MGEPTTARAKAAPGHRAPGRSFGRTVGLTVLGAVIPGSGFLAAGRRFLGFVVLGVFVLGLLVVAGAFVYEPSPTMLGAELASRPSLLNILGFVVIVAAVCWVAVIVVSHLMLRTDRQSGWQQGAGVGLVLLLCGAVLAPSVFVTQSAWATRDLVNTVFPSEPSGGGGINPSAEPPSRDDPWKNMPRLNVLLLGGDSGPDREGLRTDTMIVASINTHTGDTVLFSLPRNLQDAPIPEDNPLHELWPNGYKGGSGSGALLLNGLYREAADYHPDLFPGDSNPGITTLRGVIGEILDLDINYYVLVNLEGFEDFVDALGGIDIDVGPDRVPIGGLDINGNPQPDYQIEEWIPAGQQHLNGYQTLWLARDRASDGADDYTRMRRQRCIINAIVEEASPTTVLTHYREIASTAEATVTTDVPQQLLPALVELGDLVRANPVRSLPFTDEVITTAEPDFQLIRRLVKAALIPPPTSSPAPTATPTDVPTSEPTETETEPSATPSGTATVDPTIAVPADQVCG